MTNFAPHKALKLIARGKLTFDERVVLHRVGTETLPWAAHARPFECYPVCVLGAVCVFLEPFCGHLSPKVGCLPPRRPPGRVRSLLRLCALATYGVTWTSLSGPLSRGGEARGGDGRFFSRNSSSVPVQFGLVDRVPPPRNFTGEF